MIKILCEVAPSASFPLSKPLRSSIRRRVPQSQKEGSPRGTLSLKPLPTPKYATFSLRWFTLTSHIKGASRLSFSSLLHILISPRRVPVVDHHSKLLGIVSQSRIIREINPRINLFSFRSKRVDKVFTMRSLRSPSPTLLLSSQISREVVGLDHNQSVSDALELIKSRRITAVAYPYALLFELFFVLLITSS